MKNLSLMLVVLLVGGFAFAQPNSETTVVVKKANETLVQINQGFQHATTRKSVSLFANTNPATSDQKNTSPQETK
jgi:hypothetical protein